MRLILLALLLAATTKPAGSAERLLVVELFTSQGCSSCPPADALLSELARTDATLLPLGLHVTYWDRLGWKDPYSLADATQRQRDYAARLGLDSVYTPQIVVGGRYQGVGSDPAQVRLALVRARQDTSTVPLSLTADPAGLRVHAGSGPGSGTLYLVGFDSRHSTQVRTGENSGRTLPESNIVRSIAAAAPWHGAPLELTLVRPAGERTAILLQSNDGIILGAATLP